MRVFIVSLVAVAVLATGGAVTLNAFQQSAAEAYAPSSVRFNQQERVNLYGREG